MPSEYVIPADVVKAWGVGHFENYRSGAFKKLAGGGLASGGKVPSLGNNGSNQEFTLQIVNITPDQKPPNAGQNSQQIINVINGDIARKGPTFKSIKAAITG